MNDQDSLQLTIERFSWFIEQAQNMVPSYDRLCKALYHDGIQPTVRLLGQIKDGLKLAKDLEWFITRFKSITEEYNTCSPEFIESFVHNEAKDLARQLGELIENKTRPIPDATVIQNGKSLIDELQELKASMN